MAKLDVSTVKLPQPYVDVAVDFYDIAEKRKFLNYPTAKEIGRVVANGVRIPTEQFLTYYLFHKKRPGKPRWRNYDEVGGKIHAALAELYEFVDFNGTSISTPRDVGRQERAITEHLGETIGLSVVNEIHGFTEADWDRIPEQGGRRGLPTFDYKLASDGAHTVQIEAKGCSTSDNLLKPTSVSNHKASITVRKQRISQEQARGNYLYPANVRYGTIAVIGEDDTVPARCLLVDPPPDPAVMEPRFLRLIQRMRFLRDWISFVSPRSQLASAISTRVAALEKISNPFELANVPLRRGNNAVLELEPVDVFGHTTFFYSKAWVTDGPAGGVVIRYGRDLLLLGFREDFVHIAAAQDFQRLLDYRAQVGSLQKAVDIELSVRRFRQLELPAELSRPSSKAPIEEGIPGRIQISLTGELHYTAEGLVFGVLPVPRG